MNVCAAAVRQVMRVAVFLAIWGAVPAQALVVTVSGTDYDIRFYGRAVTFSTNAATLTDPASAPWFSDATGATAQAFRDAYAATGTPYEFDEHFLAEFLLFAYEDSTVGQHGYYSLRDSGHTASGTQADGTNLSTWRYAYVQAAPAGPATVPEIDGNALFKALFCLFTLAVWLEVRRRRVA